LESARWIARSAGASRPQTVRIQLLRSQRARIPIVVLTGHDLKAYLKPAALAAGAVSYVTKPCFPERLAHEISVRLAARLDHATGAP